MSLRWLQDGWMQATSSAVPSRWRSTGIVVFQLAVIIPTLALGGWLLAQSSEDFRPILLLWSVLIALVELLAVPVWRGLQMGVGFPLLLMVAILYPPGVAGLI